MSQQFLTLAGQQLGMTVLGLIAIMGIVDGLVIKRVYFQFQGYTKAFTGISAHVIGFASVVLAFITLSVAWLYSVNLTHYCKVTISCYTETPVRAVFFAWVIPICYFLIVFFFIDWIWRRRKGIRLQMTAIVLTSSGPHIHATIQARLAEAHEPQMSKKKIEALRDKINSLIPLLLLQSRQIVIKNGVVDASKVAQILLAMPDYRNEGTQLEIVVTAIAEEYVNAINHTAKRR